MRWDYLYGFGLTVVGCYDRFGSHFCGHCDEVRPPFFPQVSDWLTVWRRESLNFYVPSLRILGRFWAPRGALDTRGLFRHFEFWRTWSTDWLMFDLFSIKDRTADLLSWIDFKSNKQRSVRMRTSRRSYDWFDELRRRFKNITALNNHGISTRSSRLINVLDAVCCESFTGLFSFRWMRSVLGNRCIFTIWIVVCDLTDLSIRGDQAK